MFGPPVSEYNDECLLPAQSTEANIDAAQNYSNNAMTYDMTEMSGDCQGQAAAVQALIDLDSSSTEQAYPTGDAYAHQMPYTQMLQKSGKRACNCAKSHCLKLYCECFARGQPCDGCNCSNCMNNTQFEDERRKAIKLTLDRNPLAFYPKIGKKCLYNVLFKDLQKENIQRVVIVSDQAV